jgi:hypothetical protein
VQIYILCSVQISHNLSTSVVRFCKASEICRQCVCIPDVEAYDILKPFITIFYWSKDCAQVTYGELISACKESRHSQRASVDLPIWPILR